MGVALDIGDVVAIPVNSTETVGAVVLYLSRHFKNVMLVGVPAPTHAKDLSSLALSITALLYTSRASVDAGRWPVVSKLSGIGARALSERIVAENVWVEDELIRPATDQDRHRLPVMRVAGEGAVEQMLGQIVTGKGLSKMASLIARESNRFLTSVRTQ